MSWNGDGVFNRLYNWVQDFQNGLDINATRMDADTDDITTNGFGNCITRDGQGVATAQIPFIAGATFGSTGQASFDSSGNLTLPGGSLGTVTTVSVVTANGVSGSVATATTTPAITLALAAITPTTIVASSTVAGSNLSGTNTGDQTITLTGDVTGSGTGSFAATLAATAVTPAAYTLANITVDQKGRITAAASGTVPGAAQQGIFFEDSGSISTIYAFGGCSASRTGTGSYTITLGSTALVVGSWTAQAVNNGSGDTVGTTCSTTTALSASNSYAFTTRFASSKSTANASSFMALFY